LLFHYRDHYGLDCTLIRSSPIYGKDCDRPRFLWNFLEKARRGEPITAHSYENGLPALDLLHIDDAAAALAKVVLERISGVLHLGGGELVTTSQVAEWFIDHYRSASRLTLQSIRKSVGNILMDTRRTRELLNWKPRRSWKEGMEEFTEAKP